MADRNPSSPNTIALNDPAANDPVCGLRPKGHEDMLKLRRNGIRDYYVFEGRQRIGRIRFADERTAGIWLWNVTIHLAGGLPMGSAKDADTAKADFERPGRH